MSTSNLQSRPYCRLSKSTMKGLTSIFRRTHLETVPCEIGRQGAMVSKNPFHPQIEFLRHCLRGLEAVAESVPWPVLRCLISLPILCE